MISTENHSSISSTKQMIRQCDSALILPFNQHLHCNTQLSSTRCHLKFLLTCIRHRIIPNSFRIKNHWNNSQQINNILVKTSFKLINSHINFLYAKEHRLSLSVSNNIEYFKSRLNPYICEQINNISFYAYHNNTNNLKKLHQQKLNSLGVASSFKAKTEVSQCINLTNTSFTPAEIRILGLDPKCSVPPSKPPIVETIANIHQMASRLPATYDAPQLFHSAVDILSKPCQSCPTHFNYVT